MKRFIGLAAILFILILCGVVMAANQFTTTTMEFPGMNQSVHFEMQFPDNAPDPATVRIMDAQGIQRLEVVISPDGKGNVITLQPILPDVGQASQPRPLPYVYWPTSEQSLECLKADHIEPRSWHGQWLRGRVDLREKELGIWAEGLLVYRLPWDKTGLPALSITVSKETALKSDSSELVVPALQVPVDLNFIAGVEKAEPSTRPSAGGLMVVDGVTFKMPADGKIMDLQQAGWPDAQRDPDGYYELYDDGPYFLGDKRQPLLRVPNMDYLAAHVLASASEDPKTSNILTLRTGPTPHGQILNDQVNYYDYPVAVPRTGGFGHLVVPMIRSQSQDIVGVTMDVQPTREIRLARHAPDPNRFRWRPLGLPSGVKIQAITLELSPLQMKVVGRETGNAFVQPQLPAFDVALANISDEDRPFMLSLIGTSLDGKVVRAERKGLVQAGKSRTETFELDPPQRGYYDLRVQLEEGSGKRLVVYQSSFAVLPPDTRRHRETSPFGTWDFCGQHFTGSDPDVVGPLYVKMGLHYGMFQFPPAALGKYGVRRGNEFALRHMDQNVSVADAVDKAAEAYRKQLELYPDTLDTILIFHEDSISGPHETRVPDLFTDRPPFKMDPAEQERFKTMWDFAHSAVKRFKEIDPKLNFMFGNGTLTVKEAFLRNHFPAELFDSLGNEVANFGRPPEAQPPDTIAFNASIWMDRQLLDAYGYQDKPVEQCVETGYPSSNPGNLSQTTQADYFARMALHSLAWGMDKIRLGVISDVGNSYQDSNWGKAGFCHAYPALNVKPAFVSMATLTLVLDGARFLRVVPMGSPSLYGMEFQSMDGKYVTAMWTIHGNRPMTITFEQPTAATVMDDQANEREFKDAKELVVTLSSSPCYLISPNPIRDIRAGEPEYNERPEGQTTVLSKLSDMNEWNVEPGQNPELEYYNFMCPRRKGDFRFHSIDAFQGRGGVIQVTPRPIEGGKATVPMYAVLRHKSGVAMPGTPTQIGLWVNGNSSWGRIIFEFHDASGQRWISIGARQAGQPSTWLRDNMAPDMTNAIRQFGISDWNTDDAFGFSRINFDGWRYVEFPLPGQYPGEHYAWPANSQWKWDKDGIVHYPLTFTGLAVVIPEKTLHVKDFAPAPRPDIYLSDLVSVQGTAPGLKRTVEP